MTAHQDRSGESRPSNSGDYEREAEATRRRLAQNLDELSDRLTPGQVFDEMLTYSRAGGGTFLRAFNNAVKENPLPSLLIGAGCMMFLSEKMGLRPAALASFGAARTSRRTDEGLRDEDSFVAYGASGSRVPPRGGSRFAEPGRSRAADAMNVMSDAAGSVGASARSMAGAVQSGVSGASETARSGAAAVGDTMRQSAAVFGERASNASDAVRAAASSVGAEAASAADAARRSGRSMAGAARGAAASVGGSLSAFADTASSLGSAASDTGRRTRRQAVEAVRQSRETAVSFVTEQPLICAAIGVAVGAALATLLPGTETEDSLMGETSDAVKGRAGDLGSDALERTKTVAGKVVDRAQAAVTEAVRQEGLSTSTLADAANRLGESVREDARSAVREMAASAPSQADGGHSSSSGKPEDAGAFRQPITGTGPQEGVSGSRLD